MPEGDTIHRAAERLERAVGGRQIVDVDGSHPAIRRAAARVRGSTVESVQAVGKHVLLQLDNGWTIRTHQGMPGSWHLYRPGERWRRPAGAARVILHTDEWVAVCFSAPTVQVDRSGAVQRAIAHLGQDVMADHFDSAAFLDRARRPRRGDTVADLLLDQRVLAGVGNVFKNETLFLERINPAIPVGDLDDQRLIEVAERARRLMQANRAGGRRSTTGRPSPADELWVHDRSGRPCRRCGTPIVDGWIGRPARITFWCPACQSGTASPSARS